MALTVCPNDPNYKQQMEERAKFPEQWGAGKGQGMPLDTPQARIGRRISAHFGLSPAAQSHINLVAQKLLDAVKGDEAKVQVEAARADLIERGILS